MARKILILGTSNSLLRGGWVDGLRHALPDCEIQNRSIGASPGIQFCALLDTDFSQYDYVFFDSIPNDEEYQYTNRGYSDIEFTTEILHEIFSTVTLSSQLIVLGICTKRFFDNESEVYSLRRCLAYACGAEFIDTREILRNHSGFFARRSGVRNLYDTHPSHPLPQHMFLIGRLIGSLLGKVTTPSERIGRCHRERYSVWHSSQAVLSGLRIVHRSNSLLSEDFVLLSDNEELGFDNEGSCIGFYVNYRGTNATITLHTHDSVDFHINLFSGVDDRVLKIFVPIPNGRSIKKISVRADSAVHSYTPIMFRHARGEQTKIELQISHAVFAKKTKKERFDIEDLANHKIESNTPLMVLLEKTMEKEVDSLEDSSKRIGLTDNFGRHIYFDSISNKCIAAGSNQKLGRSEGIWPVALKDEDGQVSLFAEIGGGLFLLSIYPGGISLSKSSLLSVATEGEVRHGHLLEASDYGELGFSLSCGGKFLSSQPDGRIVCDRDKARDWERFKFEY